jgi:hypothetical protein
MADSRLINDQESFRWTCGVDPRLSGGATDITDLNSDDRATAFFCLASPIRTRPTISIKSITERSTTAPSKNLFSCVAFLHLTYGRLGALSESHNVCAVQIEDSRCAS